MRNVGLRTQIWNNNFWSLAMLSTLPVSLFLMVWGTIYVYFDLENNGLFIDDFWSTLFMSKNGQPLIDKLVHKNVGAESLELAIAVLPLVLILVVLWYGVAWALNIKIMRSLTGANLVTRSSHPTLYNLVENLAISRGLSTPRIAIIRTQSLNAFASGVDNTSYMITVTSGLLDCLSKEELEAVLAHEITHIQNNDVRLMVVVTIFAGMISILLSLAAHLMLPKLFSSDDIDGLPTPHVGYYLFMMMVWIFANIALAITLLSKFAISRRREYMADAGAVELTKNPGALIRALRKLEGKSVTRRIPGEIAEMCVMPAVLHDVFSTHPSIKRRIQAIQSHSGYISHKSDKVGKKDINQTRKSHADHIYHERITRISQALEGSTGFDKQKSTI